MIKVFFFFAWDHVEYTILSDLPTFPKNWKKKKNSRKNDNQTPKY